MNDQSISEQVVLIPLNKISPHPNNRKVGGFDKKKLQQLAESIKTVGVQQPAVVRRRTNNQFELVTGERRWRACKLAGIANLPCVIRDIDDINMMKIQTIENLQREDVHPLDEAEGYRRLIDIGNMSVQQIAEEIGQTRSYIYHRLKLCELDAKVRNALLKEKISTEHAEIIARLPGHYQDKALDFCFERIWNGNAQTTITLPTKIIRKRIAQQILCDLNISSFNKDDAELLPDAGPCTTCPKRTGNASELFPELEGKDYCTDPQCYDLKRNANVKKKRKEFKSKDEDFVEAQGEYGWNDPDGKNAIPSWQWQECQEKEKDAKKVLIVSGADKGRVTYGKVEEHDSRREDSFKWEIENKKNDIDRKCIQAINSRILEDIRTWYQNNKDTWTIEYKEISIIAEKLFEKLWYEHQKRIIKIYNWNSKERSDNFHISTHLSSMNEKDLLIFILNCTLINIMDPYSNDNERERLRTIATLRGIDIDKIENDTKKEYQEKWKKIKATMQKEHKKNIQND